MKRTINDLDLVDKRVLIRVDFNVPLADKTVRDDTRIRASLPTIRFAAASDAVVILVSHLGRPKGQRVAELSLRSVGKRLSELLERRVTLATDCVGAAAEAVVDAAQPGDVILLENVRFHAGEEANDPEFAAHLGALADVYVNDAFGTAHRAHASTVGVVPHVVDAGAGLHMVAELEHLGLLLAEPERPYVAVVGGSKVSGKLAVLENFAERVDTLLIGGAMAYTFFKARRLPTGGSLVEPDLLDATRRIEDRAKAAGVGLKLPTDHVVAERIEEGIAHETIAVDDPAIGNRLGLDIGSSTRATYATAIGQARTVMWNGPMGVFEIDDFAEGTVAVARAVADSPGRTVIGGGDSFAAAAKAGVIDRITHVSTGGGASLQFLGGRTLPGVEALPNA